MPSRRLSGAPGGLQDGGEAGNRGAFCRGGWLSIEPQGSVSAIGRSSCLTSMLSGSSQSEASSHATTSRPGPHPSARSRRSPRSCSAGLASSSQSLLDQHGLLGAARLPVISGFAGQTRSRINFQKDRSPASRRSIATWRRRSRVSFSSRASRRAVISRGRDFEGRRNVEQPDGIGLHEMPLDTRRPDDPNRQRQGEKGEQARRV